MKNLDTFKGLLHTHKTIGILSFATRDENEDIILN